MDDVLSSEEKQSLKDLDCHSSDHVHCHSLEFQLSTQFVEIDVKQLEDEAGMAPKEKAVFQLHDVALSSGIHHRNSLQDPHFHFGLSIELGLVSDDLHCHQFSLSVVEGFEDLTKRALSQQGKHFVSIGDCVSGGHSGLAVAAGEISQGVDPPSADEMHLVAHYFLAFKLSQKGKPLGRVVAVCLASRHGATAFGESGYFFSGTELDAKIATF